MQKETFGLGSPVAIHARKADGSVGEQVGTGRIIHPQLVQVLPPLDGALTTKARRAKDFLIVTDRPKGDRIHEVFRIRPGLVSHAEAGAILAREFPRILLAEPSSDRMVAFETEEWLADDPDQICARPWWCRIICLSSCGPC